MKIFNNCCFVLWLCHNKTLNSKIIYMRERLELLIMTEINTLIIAMR